MQFLFYYRNRKGMEDINMAANSFRMPPLSSESITDYRVFHGKDDVFDYVVGMHYHEHYEIYMHKSGGTSLAIDQATNPLEPYDLYIIPPFHLHGVLSADALRDYDRMWVHITPEFLTALGADIIPFRKRIDEHVKSGNYRLSLSEEKFNLFCRLIDSILEFRHENSPYGQMKAFLTLGNFFNELCQILETDSVPQEVDDNNPLIHQIFNYINENCTDDISLDTLSARFNISKYYLSHVFTKVYNISVYRYTLMCRIAMAQRLILKNDNLTNIAQRCGFNDYSNFLRAFSQITGTTPSTYRKKVMQDNIAK